MKQTADKAPKKPGSSWTDVFLHHAAIQPLLDHDLPRTPDKNALARGRDFSQVPLKSMDSPGQNTNVTQSCRFTPQRRPFGGACHPSTPRVQAKLTINQPGDEYEQEADRVADEVMRTPDRISRPVHSTNGPAVQKEETKTSAPKPDKEKLVNPELPRQLPQPDFLKLRTPFLERNASGLWDPASALNVWKYNFDFFKRLGLKDDLAGKASNLTAPFAIDSQLKAAKPKWWEITDAELQTTSITLSIPLFDFGADFRTWKPLPFLQKKAREASSQPGESPRSAPDCAVPPLGTGRPLDPGLRNYFEQRFGLDLSQVRIHAGSEAAESARSVNARAYTTGKDVVFGAGEYQPATMRGKRLLAHELTHVVQQQDKTALRRTVMRRGRTVGGFFSNLFHFWGYSKETLDEYLLEIDQNNQIQGDDDSDDMARQIVAEWKKDRQRYQLSPKLEILLIREMLDGIVSGSDQERIMDLLEGSNNSYLVDMFKTNTDRLMYEEIHAKFGAWKPRLEFFEQQVLRKLEHIKPPDPQDKSIEQRLHDVETQYGVQFRDIFVSFNLDPGTYYKSFIVDVVVPPSGVVVTIILNRYNLQILFQPEIFIDVLWPFSNAEMSGFTLEFPGFKSKLDIEGNKMVSSTAQNRLTLYLRGLLAGTRFENPSYDPAKDPHLVSEIADPDVIGDVNRIKYNLEKDYQKSKDDSQITHDISDFSIGMHLIHSTGLPIPSKGYGIVIAPGTRFNLLVQTSGTASKLMKKNLQLVSFTINTDGIFIFKNNVKIAMLKSIYIGRGLDIKLGGVEVFVDIKELARQESPDWARGFVEKATDMMKSYDEASDTIRGIFTLGGILGPSGRKSDVAKDISIWAAEQYLGGLVRGILSEHWEKIKSTVGISDKQLEDIFGL